jgi:hypothetical protein
MKKLALGLLGLVAACGGGGGVKLVDSNVPMTCDPVLQTGCATGEKCTWIIDANPTAALDRIGHTGCAPVGTTADNAPCTFANADVNNGADTCIAGDFCIAGRCKPICNPDLVSGAGNGACADKFSCSLYRGVFLVGGNPTSGVCEPGCDPLTQEKLVGDDKPACGSPDPINPTFTCVPAGGFNSFSCAPNIDDKFAATDGQPSIPDPRTGDISINSCSPGYIPITIGNGTTAMKNVCAGLCAPVKVDEDTNPEQAPGSATALGKLIHDAVPAAGNATCFSDKKGSIAGDLAHDDPVEDCRFLWTFLVDDQRQVADTPYNDTLGLCFDYNSVMVDTDDPDMLPDTTLVSCRKLPAVIDATHPDVTKLGSAKDNGCYPLAETAPRSSTDTATRSLGNNPHRTVIQRLVYGPGALARHVFE